jgi:hypothetical protein
MTKCLLIKTQDGRSFLTQNENLPLLVEFAKVFQAEIFKVNTNDKLLTIQKLVASFCDQNYKSKPEYTDVKKIFPRKVGANHIKEDIEKQLLSANTVKLKNLKSKYKTVSYTSLCNYFSEVRKNLIRKGYNVVKISAGNYKIE